MKYALLLFLLFAICLSSGLSAQSDIEEDGFYYSSGTVYNGDQLTGYFTLQLGKVDDETLKYTIKLLDRNADQIGKTVYQRKNDFEFQRITFNGTYLALMLKESDNPSYIDILDASGERVTRKTFDHLEKARVTHLWPVKEGFVFAVSYEENPTAKKNQRRWKIGLLSNLEGEVKWEINSDNPPATSHYVGLLDADDQLLLFSTNEYDERKRRTVSQMGMMGISVETGERVFSHESLNLIWKKSGYYAAHITDEGITALQYQDLTNNRKYAISNFDRSGKLLSRHYFTLKDELLKDLSKQEKRNYRTHYWLETGHLFTSDGQLQLAVQNFRPFGTELDFHSPKSIIVDTSGQLVAKEVVDIERFKMKSKFLVVNSGFPVLSRKGKGMMQDIQFHGGPFSFAGQQRSEDVSIQYFYDREFTKEGVKYQSIHAVYYLDGELTEEIIPFESDADMVRVYPGKEGYFLVMEAYSDGSIKTRLERMDF